MGRMLVIGYLTGLELSRGCRFVADLVYFWALFGANIRNIIRNINVQNEGRGSKAV